MCATDVHMNDLFRPPRGIPVDQHANAAWQTTGNRHFVRTEQRSVEPAEFTRGNRREFRSQVGRGAEDGAGDVLWTHADVLQIGARNMQNFQLLEEAGRSGKPVLLKRGMSATIEEWLLSAEYIIAQGNPNVILCERGIRTFETATRNTMDLNAVALAKRRSHLPVIADPSHGTGKWYLVPPLALASLAAGADGVMIEVHPDPDRATSDGGQSLTCENFAALMPQMTALAGLLGRKSHVLVAR